MMSLYKCERWLASTLQLQLYWPILRLKLMLRVSLHLGEGGSTLARAETARAAVARAEEVNAAEARAVAAKSVEVEVKAAA